MSRYQMICPNCHYEWHYNQTYYDDNITRLGFEISSIMQQLTEYKAQPKDIQRQRAEWYNSAKKALQIKQKEVSELRALRKMYNEQKEKSIDRCFREIVREKVGEETYIKWRELADKEAEAYSITDMMKTPYSRANYKEGATFIAK